MTLRVEGERPQVQIENPGPGALRQVQWIRADGTTKFDGIPPGADLFLTLSNGDELRMLDGGGCELTIRVWNASAYSLCSERDPAAASKALSANPSSP